MIFLLTQNHMGLEFLKATPTVFIQSEPNFMINKAVIVLLFIVYYVYEINLSLYI